MAVSRAIWFTLLMGVAGADDRAGAGLGVYRGHR